MKCRNRYWSVKFRVVFLLAAVIALQGCAEAVVVSGMGGLVAMHDVRSTKTMFQDHYIEKEARRAIDHDPRLQKQADISVTSFNRRVLLTGQVQSKTLKTRAAKLVVSLDNVRGVENKLRVSAKPISDSWTGDSYTTARVKARLFFRDFDATRIKVVSELGHVYLMGLVTHAESDTVVAMVNDVDGIDSVTRVFEYVD